MPDELVLCLDEPPRVASAGVGVHGTVGPHDVFRLPGLWQLHLYGYSGELAFDGGSFPIRPGHVSLVPPDTEVHFLYHGRRCEHLYAHFRLPGQGERRTVPAMQDAGAEAPLLTGLLRHAVAAMPVSPSRAAAQVWAALWHTVALGGAREEAGRPHPALVAAFAYVEERLAGPLTVPEVARAAGVSHNHLTRLFRAGTGGTVVAHIRRRRMERARHLLTASTLPIPSVAAAVGIPDLQAFNKTCRRELGESPRRVRQARGGT
ncbi:AraC family transcriptional regulator [Streptomyces sp. WMMC500]|uniref:AraC family transcriptional regulator n=1 Tax=Streptomyces sp. WMMC500 TaxID=3015154 RepID=UPI00248C96C8|nr:AraC family transcriptional regulator [Streptomyces sp. WMMC500]WBB57664.1 AraC family transcriptional regulator [Streptomyces sp. WMMC500]